MDESHRLISSRKAYRSHVTRLLKKVEEITGDGTVSTVEEPQIIALITSVEQLESKSSTLTELDTRIAEHMTDPEELENEIFRVVEIQDSISECTRLAKRVIDRSEQPQPQLSTVPLLNVDATPHQLIQSTPAPTRLEEQQEPHVNQSTVQPADSHVEDIILEHENTYQPSPTQSPLVPTNTTFQFTTRLPKLTLPTFSGNPLSWKTFWDSFSAAVHSNNSLTGVQKFNYLRAQVTGEAAQSIAGFPLTNINYEHSIALLRERFGQTQKIVNAHMQALLTLPNPTNNMTSLRSFHDSVENHIRGLSALGQSRDSYGALLVPIILGKLPVEIKRNVARDHPAFEWSIDELREAILKEIRVFEAGVHITPHPITDPPSMTATFYAGAPPPHHKINRGSRDRACVYCKGTYSTTNCTVITDHHKRLDYIKKEGLCFNCLAKHRVAQCTSRNRCKQCSRKHHTSVCEAYANSRPPLINSQPGSQPNEQGRTTVTENAATPPVRKTPASNPSTPVTTTLASNPQSSVLFNSSNSVCLLKTAVTKVKSDKTSAVTNVLFDEGAQRSFTSQQLADALQLTPLRQETITLAPFGADSMTPRSLSVASIKVVTETGELIPISVLIVPKIAAPLQTVSHFQLYRLPYLQGLALAHPITGDRPVEISLLIGVDHYWKLVGDHVIRGDGPTAVQSKLGYLLSGPLYHSNHTQEITNTFHVSVSPPNIEQVVEKFWTIESTGTLPTSPQPQSRDHFTDDYLASIVQEDSGSYVVKFPWRDNHAPLPSNFKICERRTRALVRRLNNMPDLMRAYNDIIKEQERRGFIEKIDSSPPTGPVHYIPHHHVNKDSKTTPIRIVYDCSCRLSGNHPSLNDCLEVGPSLVNDLCSILLRFRVHKIALSTDIEKAFLHVKLDAGDQDFTHFLWLSNPNDAESDFDIYRFKVVLFGSASSPFMLGATLHLHLNKYNSQIAHDMQQNLYVDNVISGSPTEESAIQYFNEARKIMSDANFNLRSWASNSQHLQAVARDNQVIDENQLVYILGLYWNTAEDRICLIPKPLDSTSSSVVTKRSILQDSSRVYDPLGLLSLVTIRAKLLMQELWQQSVDWDEPLDQQLRDKWRNIVIDLQNSTGTTMTRRYFPGDTENDECTAHHLHIFADASMKAYGVVVYICKGNITSFVIAKTRVAPIKQLTLPQLELMAALVATRLGKFVTDSLGNLYNNISVHLWSDSQIVLHWIHSEKKLKQFVAHRIQEITQTFPTTLWNYCPTKDNPADLLTRGTASAALSTPLWTNGPSWLSDESRWPQWNPTLTLHLQTDDVNTDRLTPMDPTEPLTGIHKIIDISKYSTLTKLLRVTSYVLRIITNLRDSATKQTGPLSVNELNIAQFRWIFNCQQQQYPREIQHLKSDRRNKKCPTLVRQLQLFLDDRGYLRCGGRIHNAPVSNTTKFPYLLPSRHTLTTLIVLATHATQLHGGVNRTVTALRQRFWITSARRFARSVLRTCVTCKRVCGKPYSTPDPPPLPKSRTQLAPPFTVTGVDFTGALYVRTKSGEEKAYICLFTCANTRAIHLEVVSDLSEESFLQAFRRFVSRRSLPEMMILDNASTYLSAASEIEQLVKSTTVQDTLRYRGTTWQFIPKRAPWYGGFWERLIGLTKMTMKKVLGRTFVSLTSLQTIATEIEAVLNDRPITYMSSDVSDPEPLTPAHLLYGRRIVPLPYPTTDGSEIDDPTYGETTGTSLRTRVTQHAQMLQHFQHRWRQEYLTSLRELHRTNGKNEQCIKVGDIVLIHDDIPRLKWKMAVVEQLIQGRDGYTRAANIRYNGGRTNRPITKLYPLELSSTTSDIVDRHSSDSIPSSRPTRNSTTKARQKIANWTRMLLSPAPEDVED